MSAPLPWGDTQSPWTIGQVKHLGSVTLGKMLQTKDAGQDVLAPYMRAANVQPDGVLALDDVKAMWFSPSELGDLTLRQGDAVVVEGGQGGFGRAAYVGEDLDGWGFQNSINRIRPTAGNSGRFLAYYLIALRATGFIRRYCNVVSMPHLTAEKLSAIPIPLPSGAEQHAIADYLDRETSQIDVLIAAQERFMRFLRERRGAVVDLLLEEASEHGQVPLRYVAADITVGIVVQPSQWYVDNGVPALRGVNVRPGRIVLDDLVFISDDGHRHYRKSQLSTGDVVVVRTGQSGAAAVIPESLDGANAIDLLVIKPGKRLLGSYLEMVLNTPTTRERSSVEVVGSIQGHLNVAALRALTIPVPPVDKQQEMIDRWREQAEEIDTLIAKTERHIELAKDRRIALITAAVTGQIDIPKEA
ncbi:restriction endonuclease subunit S [Streptomyces albidoflavus]|uniref:restriction endonuclease subunit S n=1 Tax=Streptomyces albidoflavus TaxID=1886 RepID=UPI00188DB295|nr:restriction endonuclease subunit S [Streptomyces albidoflavus]MBF4133819.1 restriction endonuclease subunit S [Streptomyces albidoflavus]